MLVLLLVLVLLAGGVGGLYLLIRNGTISQHSLMNTLGMGTGEIQVSNLSDGTLTADLTDLGTGTATPSSGSNGSLFGSTHTMKSLETQNFVNLQPGRYDLHIGTGANGGPCALKIDSGDVYHVAILRTAIVITRDKEAAQTKADVTFPTSSLCQR
jgi:hypothetical protein